MKKLKCSPPFVIPESVSKFSLTLFIGLRNVAGLKGDLLFSFQYFERGDFRGDCLARVRMYSAIFGLEWLTTLHGDCRVKDCALELHQAITPAHMANEPW